MPYRVLVRLGDRVKKHLLEEGESVLGSSGECAIKVSHPTVSRRHACLMVGDDGVNISDLGSSNGTRVDGERIKGAVRLELGKEFLVGAVEAWVERVDAGDIEVAVAMAEGQEAAVGGSIRELAEAPLSTIGPEVLQTFCLGELPRLVERMRTGGSRSELAQAVGEAILRTFPCRLVEVTRSGGSGPAVVFSGQHGDRSEGVEVVADAGEGLELTVRLTNPVLAKTYGPLITAAAGLIELAGHPTEQARAAPDPAAATARMPDPPSVVSEVCELYRSALRVATSKVSVLIRGESGTGKELFARFLHAASDRAGRPLVTLNCAALPRDLQESELFGVERGVATGVEERAGRFEAAHGGTIFLDEIGDMAAETQAKILRVLQEGEVHRLGGRSPRPADVRVISATNRDLDAMLASDRFRTDLYHRIADWVVELPPLRRRKADIPNLAAYFLARACSEHGVRAAGISRSAVEVLQAYSWPGNVRQLEREMNRIALFLEDGDVLEPSLLQQMIRDAGDHLQSDALKTVVDYAERAHILRILVECDWVVSAAAGRLQVGPSTVYRRMRALGIEEPEPSPP